MPRGGAVTLSGFEIMWRRFCAVAAVRGDERRWRSDGDRREAIWHPAIAAGEKTHPRRRMLADEGHQGAGGGAGERGGEQDGVKVLSEWRTRRQ